MKLNFWFDLPNALTSIAAESLTTEEAEYSRLLQKSTEVSQNTFIQSYKNFRTSIEFSFNLTSHWRTIYQS